jgi:hypothetical protein
MSGTASPAMPAPSPPTPTPSPPTPTPLSNFDKKVIRRYIWTVVWPSAAVIAVIAAVLGYAARGLGESAAVTTMHEHMTKPIIDGVQRVTIAEADALKIKHELEEAEKDVNTLRGRVKLTQQEASDFLEQAQTNANQIAILKARYEKWYPMQKT